jgi:hypothetical protein
MLPLEFTFRGARMRLVVTRYAARLSNRIPELVATACYIAGGVACILILKGRIL